VSAKKKKKKMQKANDGMTKMDMVRRKLPCVRRLMMLYRERVVRGSVPMPMERKKKGMKKRKKKIDRKSDSVA
jgi:hypothetical protein